MTGAPARSWRTHPHRAGSPVLPWPWRLTPTPQAPTAGRKPVGGDRAAG